jgi:lysophospholipase L1-like esterase
MMKVRILSFLFLVCFMSTAFADKLALQKGDRVAIIGDSITEQKVYSKYLELYFTLCLSELNLDVMQFGWGGETAPAFTRRMAFDIAAWKPTVATTCYGMNDGKYRPYEDFIGNHYRKGMETIVDFMKKSNVKMILGSPGVVDSHSWRSNEPEADVYYNANLAKLSAIVKDIARKHKLTTSDVNSQMSKFMKAAKAKYGQQYVVGGRDGIHPEANGHFIMAYSFLKSLKLPEKIAEINIDFQSQKVELSQGHKLQSKQFGAQEIKIQVESSKYPFCFHSRGELKNENNLLGVLPFIDFQEKFNNFELKVNNIPTKTVSVRWGTKTKTFTKKELATGINLADEFIENPFQSAFLNISNLIYHKQRFETSFVKRSFSGLRAIQGDFTDDKQTMSFIEQIKKKYINKHAQITTDLKRKIKAIDHEIVITLIP